jgi:hypothetical protein
MTRTVRREANATASMALYPGMRGFDNISLTAPIGSEFSGDAGQTTRVLFQEGKLDVFDQESGTRL